MEWFAITRQWVADHKLNLFGFAVAAAYWPGMASAAVIPRWAVIAAGVPLISTMDPRAIPESLRWAFLFLFGVAAIATFGASPDPYGGALELFFIVILCLVFIAAASLDSIDGLMKGMGWGLLPSAALAICQYNEIWSPVAQATAGPTGLFYNSEILAEFAALVAVWAYLRRELCITLICLVPLGLCHSRIAALTIAVALMYAWWPRGGIYRTAIVGLFIAGGLTLLLGSGLTKIATADHRLIIWLATIAAWTQFGHGLGWFLAAHPPEEFAHSDALQTIAELGIGGLALIAVPVAVFRRNRGCHVERAVFVAVCTQVVISFPLHFPASGFLAAIVAGFLVGDRSRLRVGQHQRGSENAGDFQWPGPHGAGDLEPCGFGGGTVSVRSLHPSETALYPPLHQ